MNGFIALVFLVFGLSLLGAFEITIPSGVLTSMDRASQRGGILGTLLMGLTFSLTAFACVGPFVGTLLAGSVSGGGMRPLAGMVAFASGLALPFFLLALFPSYLERLPKSGGWMARVKVVLGFVILAAMLKYLSNVDAVLQWNVLTRERFLAALGGAVRAARPLPARLPAAGGHSRRTRSSGWCGCCREPRFWSSPSACCRGCSADGSANWTPMSRSAPGQKLVWMKNDYAAGPGARAAPKASASS